MFRNVNISSLPLTEVISISQIAKTQQPYHISVQKEEPATVAGSYVLVNAFFIIKLFW